MSWREAQRAAQDQLEEYARPYVFTWQVKRIDDDCINYCTQMFSVEMTTSMISLTEMVIVVP